jgi:hypothetical protein
MIDFLYSTTGMIVMGVILVALVILLIYMRNQKSED